MIWVFSFIIIIFFFSFDGPQLFNAEAMPFTYSVYDQNQMINSSYVCYCSFCTLRKYARTYLQPHYGNGVQAISFTQVATENRTRDQAHYMHSYVVRHSNRYAIRTKLFIDYILSIIFFYFQVRKLLYYLKLRPRVFKKMSLTKTVGISHE